MYRIGGLEPSESDGAVMKMDGIDYVVSDKFRTMLRDSFIDWGTFLEIYHDNLDYTNMFDQIVKLLNVKENENIREFMLPLIDKIYHLPADAHMACMLKQFMIYEPVSVAIHTLFTTIRLHYEEIVIKFLTARNRYLSINNVPLAVDKPNDIEKLKHHWTEMNEQYNLDTSSLVLLFINPPTGIKSGIKFNITAKKKVIDKLKIAVKKFHYPGFCPKVPHQRLKGLLLFPINEFVAAIKEIDSDAKFPDYKSLEKTVAHLLESMPKKPHISDTYERKKPPANLKDKLAIAQWYVEAILDMRKEMLPHGQKYEEFYVKQAEILMTINDEVKKEFAKLN